MKQYFTKKANVLWIMFDCLMVLFVLIYLVIHLSGIWEINVCGLRLDFESLTGISILVVSSASLMRDRVDARLAARNTELDYGEHKKRRQSLRHAVWAIWFATYFPVYTYCQMYYAHLGSRKVNLFNLIVVLSYGIVGAVIAIPMPKTEDPKVTSQ